MNKRQIYKFLLILCVLAYLPFLGLFDYNTKGEPRESIVSYSMIEDGNWILPRNNGGEMAYKPPFFHWTVALASLPSGQVSEYSSRLPSAIAFILLILASFEFFAKRNCHRMSLGYALMISFAAALINLSCNELHRAGSNCRVDMVLTFFTVCAMYLLYRWWERGSRRLPVGAILLMSCATLTKGPVGSIIPCLVTGVFLLLKGVNFWKALWRMFYVGILSLIIPAVWYYLAWRQGGQEFLDLMLEENIGRMTNTMAYDSCNEPWPYNFLTLIIGYLPYTILLLVSVFTSLRHIKGVKREIANSEFAEEHQLNKELEFGSKNGISRWWSKAVRWVRNLSPLELYSLVAVLVIFIFYCIPQSKRSVYLMPMYPFLSYFIARYLFWLAENRKKVLVHFNTFLCCLVLIVSAAFIAVKLGAVPDTVFSGKHAGQNIAMLHSIENIGSTMSLRSAVEWICIALSVVVCIYWFVVKSGNGRCRFLKKCCVTLDSDGKVQENNFNGYVFYMLTIVVAVYFAVDAAYKPAALNSKSVKPIVQELRTICPAGEGGMYEYIEEGETALGDPLHYFELNFYLGNVIENFKKSQPEKGFLLIGQKDADLRLGEFEQQGYSFELLYSTDRKVAGQLMNVYRFVK